MKKTKDDYVMQFTALVQELRKDYPTTPLGQHLSTAFADYGDVWGCSDKELVYALEKYKITQEIDFAPQQDIDKIIADAQDFTYLLESDLEEED